MIIESIAFVSGDYVEHYFKVLEEMAPEMVSFCLYFLKEELQHSTYYDIF